MKSPKVSIIIPVYNGSNYLANAIECALNQTYNNIEIIVVNDGSTDDGKTEEIALAYGDKIHYYCKENGGVSSALNYGIKKMSGQYFSWLSHDDAYAPEKIEKSVELLESNNLIGKNVVAFTGGYFIDTSGNKIKDFAQYFTAGLLYSGFEVVSIMTKKGTLNGCCMLIPKTAFEEVGYFDESLRYSQDSLMWYNIFLSGFSLISDNLPNVMYRLHRNQASQLRRDLYENDSLVIAKFLAEPLSKIDNTGKVLMQYIKRLTKYHSKDAVEYLLIYAFNNNCLNNQQRIILKGYRFIGIFRYRIVTTVKKVLIFFRR